MDYINKLKGRLKKLFNRLDDGQALVEVPSKIKA